MSWKMLTSSCSQPNTTSNFLRYIPNFLPIHFLIQVMPFDAEGNARLKISFKYENHMTGNHTDYKPQQVITNFHDTYESHSPNRTVCLVIIFSDNVVSSVRKPKHAPIRIKSENKEISLRIIILKMISTYDSVDFPLQSTVENVSETQCDHCRL